MAKSQSDRSDVELLASTAADPAAFGRFYERYEEAVLVYMLRRTATAELAADLTAEVFASALEAAPRFEHYGPPPAAWLFRIAHNALVDSYRRAQVQDDARQRLSMPPLVVDDETADHLERLSDRSEGERAMHLLKHLPADQREALVAHILDERSYEDIAGELQCSQSVVRKRVSRGLAALRRHISEGA